MRVAYLLGSLNRGGTETLILDIFNHSGELPFSLLGMYRKEGELSTAFKNSGVSMQKLTPKSIFSTCTYLFKLRKHLLYNHIQIVHAHQRLDAIYAKLACLGLPVKVVQTYHNLSQAPDFFTRKSIRTSFRMCDKNIFVSQHQKNHYTEFLELPNSDKLEVVHNGVNFEKLTSEVNPLFPTDIHKPSRELLVGTVGNFTPGRDPMTICRFLKLLNETGLPFSFLFVGKKDEGNPEIYDSCVQFCSENGLDEKVHFLGPREDVPRILSQLDAFIYSTHHDTFGIAVIEAIATGIPVFVNDWAVMQEITDNGSLAFLYKSKSELDLFEKFTEYLKNQENIKSELAQNAEEVRQRFSIQNHVARLHEVYSTLLSV